MRLRHVSTPVLSNDTVGFDCCRNEVTAGYRRELAFRLVTAQIFGGSTGGILKAGPGQSLYRQLATLLVSRQV